MTKFKWVGPKPITDKRIKEVEATYNYHVKKFGKIKAHYKCPECDNALTLVCDSHYYICKKCKYEISGDNILDTDEKAYAIL